MTKRIELGDTAKDSITGFEGVVIARTEWLTNCVRMTLQPKGLKAEGTPIDCCAFDEPSLVLVKKRNPPAPKVKVGGPMPSVPRAKDPR